MSKSLLTSEYVGKKNRVVHCKGAIKTYEQSLTKVQSGKRKSLTRQLILQIERLARGERMSSQNFAAEAALPNASGGKNFMRLKKSLSVVTVGNPVIGQVRTILVII